LKTRFGLTSHERILLLAALALLLLALSPGCASAQDNIAGNPHGQLYKR